jgi:hypothetical protein
MMAETISETAAEEKQEKAQQLSALAELAKQTQLPIATLRRALATSGSRINPTNLLAATHRVSSDTVTTPTTDTGPNQAIQPITGQVMAIEHDTTTIAEKRTTGPVSTPLTSTGTPDKLQMTIEALRLNPDMTDEALAEYLSLKRPASARFWRLKAIEILNAPGKEQTGKTAAVRNAWSAPAGMAGKR